MPARFYDPWRDVDGAPIPQQCRVEQIAVDKEHGALRSRLHKKGQVVSRGTCRLLVRFDGERTFLTVRPHLVRVLPMPAPAGGDRRSGSARTGAR